MICFSNPGEIDIRALTTLGVNVKPTSGDSPQIHLEKGWFDGSRELQNWLFEQLIHKCEIIKGEPL